MTSDDIFDLAAKAGISELMWWDHGDVLECFAALVAAPLEEEIKRLRFCIPEGDAAAAMEYLAYCVEKAVAAEREACAAAAHNALLEMGQPYGVCKVAVDSIKERNNQ